ncbi:MAG: sulfate ABC transporter permease subunit CysW [Gloeomargaritaceae cyanobacterium C42_A2020_066]|nr:sulfate ABC transporter permease subunit CysW [Gloeomargaritaceae cyanobacterium C42_A2020_066]
MASNGKPELGRPQSRPQISWGKWLLIGLALAYLGIVVYIPTVNVFVQAFSQGVGPFLGNFANHEFVHAIKMTVLIAALAVPMNTIFGLCAAWIVARHQFRGRALLLTILDLPFSISPVVAGLMIILLYGRQGWFGPLLQGADIQIVFAYPGMVLATAFVAMPFVAREVIPVLEELGTDQEQAAHTLGANAWQTFWRVTLPGIRWGLLYGVVLTNARSMGEFGAVSAVSGNVAGKTQTLTLFVEEAYKQYQTQASYGAAVILAGLALVSLALKALLESKTHVPRRVQF